MARSRNSGHRYVGSLDTAPLNLAALRPVTRQLSSSKIREETCTRLRRGRVPTACTGAAFSRRPLARIVPRGHAPRIENPGTGPRTCAILSMSAGHSPPPWARLVPYGHAPRIENPGTGPRTCATLLMSAGHSPSPWARLVPYGHAPRNARRAGIAPRPPCLKKEIYEKETCTHISWHWTGCSGRCSPREPGQFAGFGRCCNGTPSRSRCRRASCRQYRWQWYRRWSPGCRQWR